MSSGRRAGRVSTALVALMLTASAVVGAADLGAETLRAYGNYVAAVRASFDERSIRGDALVDIAPADVMHSMRSGQAFVRAAREDGIIDAPGGLIHHWEGVVFIPGVTLQEAVIVSQDYASYARIYGPVTDARVLDQNGDAFHVLTRIQKQSGPISAVVDVWSLVRYQWRGASLVYSASDSEQTAEVRNAGKPDERRLPPGQGSGYLWRANTFSRFAARDGGVLVELENVGLSRDFPPMLGWIIEPIARRIGRASVEDSLEEFREAVLAAHRQR